LDLKEEPRLIGQVLELILAQPGYLKTVKRISGLHLLPENLPLAFTGSITSAVLESHAIS
jgi:hypothetical protein